jgi:signal transduction histidine kinase
MTTNTVPPETVPEIDATPSFVRAVQVLMAASHGPTLGEQAVREANTLFRAHRGLLSIIDPHDGQLRLLAHVPHGEPGLAAYVSPGEGLMGRVVVDGRAELVTAYATWEHRISDVRTDRIGAAMAAPIVRGDGEVHGVIALTRRPHDEPFTPIDLEGLQVFAAVVGAAIEAQRARLELGVELSQRLAAEERARAGAREKTEFMSRVSHELRTPLNAVYGFAQLLQLALEDGPHAVQVQHLLQAAQHLNHLVSDVTDIALLEGGRLSLELRAVPVIDVIEPVVAMLRTEAERNGRRFEFDPQCEGPDRVTTDPARARQILLNFGSNAIKYNRPGGLVRIVCVRRGEEFVIQVHDTGVGIPEEDLDRVFQPFLRLPSALGAASGSGLGLPLARSLAEAMHARIEVMSRVGIGSVFSLVLPAVNDPYRGSRGQRAQGEVVSHEVDHGS